VRAQQIQKYESGANRVSASRLFAFAQTLEVSVSHFFEGIEVAQSGPPLAERTAGQHSPQLTDLLSDTQFLSFAQEFMWLPEGHRDAVVALVQSLSDHDKVRHHARRIP
jgi:transcriptional regulator with XRE-family HTH domain